MNWPSKSQWNRFFEVLTRKEKIFFFGFLFLFTFSFISFLICSYRAYTEIKPARGGDYVEGVVGSPRLINPVYAPTNDVDRDLTQLIFSGLMTYDSQGKLVPDLAKEYKILENGKIYEFYLKDKLFWSDGEPLTADDIIFTIKTIQNPEFKSPIRASWLGVNIEKISSLAGEGSGGIKFRLSNPSAVFLENAALKILPKHVWQEISAQNFPLVNYNLKPVGSGPYRLKALRQDSEGKITSLTLEKNPYSSSPPYVSEISFKFFNSEKELIDNFQKGKINGFVLTSPLTNPTSNAAVYSLSLPRYFAVFFNPEKAKIFTQKEVRQALNYGTDKQAIIDEILNGGGKIVNSPILPDIYLFEIPEAPVFDAARAKELLEKAGFTALSSGDGAREKIVEKEASFQFKSSLRMGSQNAEVTELQKCLAKDPEVYPEKEVTGYFGQKTKAAVVRFQEKYADEILKSSNLKSGTGEVLTSTRKKLNEICLPASQEKISLSFSLATVDQPQLMEVAKLLKEQWKDLGVKVNIESYGISQLEADVIKSRNFDALLFGEVLGAIPDPFPFWHSSQKKDPGLNLASYESKEADKLLEENRQNLDEDKRIESLEKFQDIIIASVPAVFLYNPNYLYFIPKEIKGFETKIITDPSNRFSDIKNWYIETKRAWK
ncbi:MAG: ABC transporter substrate-binding protein [bacterium]